MGDPVQTLLPTSVHLLLFLLVWSVLAWKAQRRSRLGRWRYLAIGLVGWAWIASLPAVANLLTLSLEGSPADAVVIMPAHDESTLILVLASGELRSPGRRSTSQLNLAGWERARAGVALWRRTGGTLWFSGGPDGDPARSIATAMASVARDMGVPESALRLSPRGSNTYEELKGVSDDVRAGQGPKWLVTSATHMPRSRKVAQCLGVSITPYPVAYRQIENVTWVSWLPDPTALEPYTIALHELVGMLAYRVRYGC